MSSAPNIGITPFDSSDNAYIDRMKEILGRIGNVVPFPTPRQLFSNPIAFFSQRHDFAILNWIENLAINKDGKFSRTRSVLLLVYLVATKLVANQIIWVRHNNYPHNTEPGSVVSIKRVMSLIERIADKTITHSGHDLRGKWFYVPHPLYKTVLDPSIEIPMRDYFFVFGRILPYKKLHEAIENVPDNINLLIAGAAPDKDYLDRCKHLAEGKANIQLIPGYMPDTMACSLAVHSNGMAVFNADEDMVVSGSHFFAFSLGIPLFTVETPFIKWLIAERQITGINAYASAKELVAALATSHSISTSSFDHTRIENEFSDDAVELALRKVLQTTND